MSSPTPVLLLEDDPADARFVKEALKGTCAQNFSIDVVETLAEGLDWLRSTDYALLMLDLNLPDATGLESMRRLNEASTLPIVIISGEEDEQLAVDAVKAGAQDFVVKGRFAPEILGRALTYAIERHAMEQHRRHAEQEHRKLLARLEQSQR